MFIEDISSKKDEEILTIINDYNLKVNNGAFKNITHVIDRSSFVDMQIKHYINIYLSIVPRFKQKQIIKTMSIVDDGLKLSKNNDFDEFKENYLKIKDEFANDLFEKYNYVFENYLVNYIFKTPNMFMSRDLMGSYAEMLIYYNMIKFSMIGTVGSLRDNISESDLVLVISTISRGVEHNKVNTASLKTLIDKCSFNNLSNLIPLILN